MWISVLRRPNVPEYAIHQFIWQYFPELDGKDADRPFLYRVLGESMIVLSRLKPRTSVAVEINERFLPGSIYQFDLLANPARSGSVVLPDGSKKRTCRKPYKTNAELRDWLQRRFEGSGAELTFAQVYNQPQRRFKKPSGQKIIIDDVIFRGTFELKDRSLFMDALMQGFGGRGAWGCGLLVMPEVMTCA